MATLPKARLDLVGLTVLGLLDEQPCHPYEMQRLIRRRHKQFADGPVRTLYHAVERLQAAGLIEARETTREGKRPERTVYAITDDGREEFRNWLHDLLATPADSHTVFTSAISFLPGLAMDVAVMSLEQRVVALEAGIAGNTAALRTLVDEVGLPRLYLIEEELRVHTTRAELEWTRALLADIRRGALRWEPGVGLPFTAPGGSPS